MYVSSFTDPICTHAREYSTRNPEYCVCVHEKKGNIAGSLKVCFNIEYEWTKKWLDNQRKKRKVNTTCYIL